MAKDKDKKDKKKDKEKDTAHLDFSDEIKRLNRITGQIEGISKMLGEKRKLQEVLIQCKAIHSALRSIENRILRSHLELALDEIVKLDKKKTREEKIAGIEELFKQAA